VIKFPSMSCPKCPRDWLIGEVTLETSQDWEVLLRYKEDGDMEIDNNAALRCQT